jgi:hypothetical protein
MKSLSIILIFTVSFLVAVFLAVWLMIHRMNRKFNLEKQEMLNAAKADDEYVTEAAIQDLPSPVSTWLKSCGIIGKPVIHSASVRQRAQMKLKAGDSKWKTADAVQYTTMDPPAFIWKVNMDIAPLVKVTGRDKFSLGKGEMLIKINAIFPVARETGERIDEGTLQRYLGELVWFPSLAISPYITWDQIDESSARATMHYKGTSGSGVFHFNAEGEFTKYVALRYMGNQARDERIPWELTVEAYKVFDGIKVPSKMKATWKLDDTDWIWLDLEVTEIKYNLNN